jgi:hypothetical protein
MKLILNNNRVINIICNDLQSDKYLVLKLQFNKILVEMNKFIKQSYGGHLSLKPFL